MENPKEDVLNVVRTLVTKPTLAGQAETIRRFFSPDVRFYHYYIDTVGREELIAIYQFAELVVSYQRVVFDHVAYDEDSDLVVLHMRVYVRPMMRFWIETYFEFITMLELEDVPTENGNARGFVAAVAETLTPRRPLKRIKVQRDYFERQPILVALPIIGDIYKSEELRFIVGRFQANAFLLVREFVRSFVPWPIIRTVLSFLQDPPFFAGGHKA